MLSKEEIKKYILNTETAKHPLLNELYAIRDTRKETQDYTIYVDGYISVDVLNKTLQLESDKQKLIEKLEERMKSVEKCYQDLIKPYYDERLNMINVSFMSRKEKEEFTNKRNCLLVQKHCYAEILEIVKGVENERDKI